MSLSFNDTECLHRSFVYASLIPYAYILMDYGLFPQTFFSHFYSSITNPTRKPTQVTLNTERCFFTKQAGGKLLEQSVRILVFPLRMLFCRRSLRCSSVRDYLLSLFFHQKGSEFAFKVAHSSCFGDKLRPGKEKRHP